MYWLKIIPKKINKISFIKKSSNKLCNKINPIFIIGLPRSGSTLVEGIISSGLLKIDNGGETAIINSEIMGGCACQEEMKGGSWGQTRWFRFVKSHMKEKNMTWACALADIKKKGLYKYELEFRKETSFP